MQITTGIDIGDRVLIDVTPTSHDDIKAVVLAIMISPVMVQYKLGWFAAGVHQEEWFDEFRLTLIDAPKVAAAVPESDDYPRMGRDG